MKEEYDFTGAERGKFYRSDAKFSFPVYLETDVDEYLSSLADEKDITVQDLVNDWLRVNIQLVQSVRPRS